ncbi:MAG: pyrimidine-nucleoside phosphorylase [Clostridiales bacterium]|nr:pyrimidine-nucleoside phosphorylase [Clostridiales bacterium]
MRIYDVIANKRDKKELTKEEISFFVKGFTNNEIADYQAAALLMAILLNGMTVKETSYLTEAMAKSGDMADLSKIEGIKVDKHSTGGVGDKTTLVVAPIVATFGVPVAKMSGRGLGHTGGTLDKLQSIKDFSISLTVDEFVDNVNKIKMAVVGQTGNLAPADKKMYALRDVTATVQSIPLIASSIMSKKIAGGADAIVLDVKCGSGAFMKDIESARELAKIMVLIGNEVGRQVVAVITNMDEPLGNAIGNALEIKEAISTLKGEGPEDFKNICIELATQMIYLATGKDEREIREEVKNKLINGEAYNKFKEFIIAQHGDISVIENIELLPSAKNVIELYSNEEGYVKSIDAEKLGIASMLLGGGRAKKEDNIDYGVGVIVHKKIGDFVKKDDVIATIHANDLTKFEDVKTTILNAYKFSNEEVEKPMLIYDIIKAK